MAPIGGLEACPPGWLCRGLVLKSRRSRTLTGVFLGFLISAVALALLLRWSGWGPLWATLRQVDLRYLLAGALVFLASMLARARAWQLILKKEFGIWRVLAALNEGYLLNNILPWRMGELGRAILLGRRPGGSVMRVLSSILVERLYDVFLALSLLIALLPEAAGLPSALRSAAMVTLLLAGSATVIYVILRNPTWLRDLIGRLPGTGWEPRALAGGQLGSGGFGILACAALHHSRRPIALGLFHAYGHTTGCSRALLPRLPWSLRGRWRAGAICLRGPPGASACCDFASAWDGLPCQHHLWLDRPEQ